MRSQRLQAAPTSSASTSRSTSSSTPTTPGSTGPRGRGYFEDAGLDVRPRVPSDPSAPIKQVAAGQVDLAISYEPEVMLARDQGLDVVAVAALVHGPLTSLISLPEGGIEDPADLDGKTVVTAGIPYQTAYLETILRKAGVDPTPRSTGSTSASTCRPPLLAGRADAMLGGFLNVEGVELAEKGLDPRVVPGRRARHPHLRRAGPRRRRRPPRARTRRRSRRSSTRSSAAPTRPSTIPAAATDALLAAGDGLDPELTRAQVDATLPLLLPRRRASRSASWTRPSGRRSPPSSPTRARSTTRPGSPSC